MSSTWILTEANNKAQREYYIACFSEKPSLRQLFDEGVPLSRLRHVQKGGGPVEDEDNWYFLRPGAGCWEHIEEDKTTDKQVLIDELKRLCRQTLAELDKGGDIDMAQVDSLIDSLHTMIKRETQACSFQPPSKDTAVFDAGQMITPRFFHLSPPD